MLFYQMLIRQYETYGILGCENKASEPTANIY